MTKTKMNPKRAAALLLWQCLGWLGTMLPAVSGAVVVDLDPPVISDLTLATQVRSGEPFTMEITVSDDSPIARVSVFYRVKGETTFREREMVTANGVIYQATVPAEFMVPAGLEYYFVARDGYDNVASRGNSNVPLSLQIMPGAGPVSETSVSGPLPETAMPHPSMDQPSAGERTKPWKWLVGLAVVGLVAAATGGGGDDSGGTEPQGIVRLSAGAPRR